MEVAGDENRFQLVAQLAGQLNDMDSIVRAIAFFRLVEKPAANVTVVAGQVSNLPAQQLKAE